MALLKFLKGSYSSLNNAAINEGQVLICNDTAEMFVDVAADKRIKIGDFTVVANIAALEALDATAVPTSRLYYVEDGNILARSNGTAWIQVNKQPTIAELKTQLGLDDYATKAYVGEIPSTATATNIVAYIQEKTAGIATDTALEELTGRVATTEGEIDALQEASAKHVEKVDGKGLSTNDLTDELKGQYDAAYQHSLVDHAPANAQENVIETVKVNGEALEVDGKAVNIIIPESTKVEASETNGNIKVDGEEVTVYTHPDKHVIAEVDGLETALADKETAGAAAQALEDAKADATEKAAQALTDAKAYVDEEDKFVTDILTVDKFGGIAAGSNLNGMTTHEILNQLLYPYIAFTINSSSRNAAAATLENGASQTLNSATISVTKKSKPITSIKLLNGSTVLEEKTGDAVAAGGTITFSNLGITVTKDNNPNLKFTVTDGTTSTDKNVGASTFVYPYYMGECAADATIDETLIEGLTKKVESRGNKTVTHSCENGRMVIAYPKAHGVLKSILDPNNFETIGDYTRSEVSVTGLDGTTQTYYVYASGAATVSGFKVQYKY